MFTTPLSVSPFNDELIEIRSAPLPHDFESNQIEMKRIFLHFSFTYQRGWKNKIEENLIHELVSTEVSGEKSRHEKSQIESFRKYLKGV